MPEQSLKEWRRDTPWRQGHVLSAEAAKEIGYLHPQDEENTAIVVISHDCDLANDDLEIEPDVEVIIGRIVAAANGNYTWGKVPRTLHLRASRNGTPVHIELVSTSKCQLSKSDLAKYQPDATFNLDGPGLNVLRGWLSARYNRSAFPDEFVDRMSQTKLSEKLVKAIAPFGDSISSINFNVDDGQVIERPKDSPYVLSIVLVFPPGDDPEKSADTVDQAVDAIEKICAERLKSGKEIVLSSCVAVSEDDITISQAKVLMQWRLEHMSHKSEAAAAGT